MTRGKRPEELGCPYDRVTVLADSGCWQWQGVTDHNGYGRFGGTYAHRVYYELFREETIPPGMYTDHLCRNRACVNPDHLEVVTPRENILRGMGAAARQARKTHCKYGHEFSPENTRWVTQRGARTRMCVECNRRIQRELYARNKAEGKLPPSKTPRERASQYRRRKADAA